MLQFLSFIKLYIRIPKVVIKIFMFIRAIREYKVSLEYLEMCCMVCKHDKAHDLDILVH